MVAIGECGGGRGYLITCSKLIISKKFEISICVCPNVFVSLEEINMDAPQDVVIKLKRKLNEAVLQNKEVNWSYGIMEYALH